MSKIDLDAQVIAPVLKALQPGAADTSADSSASAVDLPTDLPLTYPSELHKLNTLATLHLVNAVFSQPQHAAYFTETESTPSDTAIRGVFGLFLASETEWNSRNLLSATAWANGELSEARLAEFFGVTMMKEKAHESLPGVTVGERWPPAVALVDDLWTTLQELGSELEKGKCQCLGSKVEATQAAANGKPADA